MVTIRATQKLLRLLPRPSGVVASPDTALGDWYATRLVVDRQPLLLLVSSTALLPILIAARDVRALPRRLPAYVGARLRRIGIPSRIVDSEVRAMSPTEVGPTQDRSVTGIMVDFAKSVPVYLEPGAWDETTLPFVESRLAETPCYATRPFEEVIFPEKMAPTVLIARWHAA